MEKDDQEEEAYKDAYDSIQIMPFSALKKLANAVRCSFKFFTFLN